MVGGISVLTGSIIENLLGYFLLNDKMAWVIYFYI